MSTDVYFDILRSAAVIGPRKGGWQMELNIVSWNGGAPRVDLREWSPNHEHMKRGVRLTETEAEAVKRILNSRLPSESEFPTERSEAPVESVLVSFSILMHLGVFNTSFNGWTKEINIISWNGEEPEVDIREWSPDHERMSKGIRLSRKESLLLAAADMSCAAAPKADTGKGDIAPTRADVAACHAILSKLNHVEDQFLDMTKSYRETLDENGDFMATLYRLIHMAENMVKESEAQKPALKMSDCCSMQPDEEALERYSSAITKIGHQCGLMNLPKEDKDRLKNETNLERKTELLERLAENL